MTRAASTIAAVDPVARAIAFAASSNITASLPSVPSRTELKAIDNPADIGTVYITSNFTFGIFIWQAGNMSAQVAGDPYGIIYNAPNYDPTGASGAWMRSVYGPDWFVVWSGFSTGSASTNHLRVAAIEAARPAGSTLVFPDGTYENLGQGVTTDDAILSATKPGRWVGGVGSTILKPASGLASHLIQISTSDFIIERMQLGGLVSSEEADAPFLINIGTRYTGADAGAITDHIKVRDCTLFDSTGGVRVINSGWPENGDAVWYHPRDIEISGNRFKNISYQPVSLWGRNIRLVNNWLETDPTGDPNKSAACAIRCVGVSHSTIANNTIRHLMTSPLFLITPAGEDSSTDVAGAEFNDPRALLISNNDIKLLSGAVVRCYGFSGTILMSDNIVKGDLAGTNETIAFIFACGGEDQRRGQFIVDGGDYSGFVSMLLHDDGAFSRLIFRNGTSRSNARTAAMSGIAGIFVTTYVATAAYAGGVIKALEQIRVSDWDHAGPDNLYNLGGVVCTNKQAGTYAVAQNNLFPFGTPAGVAVPSGTAAPFVDDGNIVYPAGHWTIMNDDATGYAHSPRYSDNGPNGNGPAVFDPTYPAANKIPTPVDED